MSDWKKRAEPVGASWKSRAEPVAPPSDEGDGVFAWLKKKIGDYVSSPSDTSHATLSAGGYGGTLPGQDPLKPIEEQSQSVRGAYAKRNEEQLAEALAFAQGGSANHVDELYGALHALPTAASKNISPSQAYTFERDKARQLTGDATDRHPGAAIAGAVATSGPAAETVPARIAIAGMLGANSMEGASKELGDSPLYAGGGGLAGAGTAATLELLIHGGSKAAPWLKNLARTETVRSLNPLKSDVAMLERSGLAESVPDDLLQSGAIKFGSTAEGTAGRVAQLIDQRGAQLGAVREGIDKAAGGAVVLPDVAGDAVEQLAREYASQPHPESQAIAQNLANRAGLIRAHGGGKPMSLTDAEMTLKAPLDKYAEKMARTPGTPPETVEALAQARRVIKQSNEGAAEAAAASMAPDLAGKFIPAKQGFQRMAAAGDILERNAPRQLANRKLTPSDYGFGIATGQAYQPPNVGELLADPVRAGGQGITGLIGSMLHKAVRERGNTSAAVLANNASKVMSPVSRFLQGSGSSPGMIGGGAESLEQFLGLLSPDQRDEFAAQSFVKGTGGR